MYSSLVIPGLIMGWKMRYVLYENIEKTYNYMSDIDFVSYRLWKKRRK